MQEQYDRRGSLCQGEPKMTQAMRGALLFGTNVRRDSPRSRDLAMVHAAARRGTLCGGGSGR